MKVFSEMRIAVIVALFLVLSAGLVQAQSTTTVLVGTVLQVIHTGDDLFVKLDTNNDGSSDALLKLSLKDIVTTTQGQKIQASDVAEGMTISTIATKDSSGYYEPFASDNAAPQTAISGTVIQVRQLGDAVFAEIDTDNDGVADLQVKLEGRDTVLDADGNPVTIGSLTVGSQITIPAYRYDSENDEFDGEESTESSSDDTNGNDTDGNDSNSDGTDSNGSDNDRNDRNDRNHHNGSNDSDGNDNDGNGNDGDDDDDDN